MFLESSAMAVTKLINLISSMHVCHGKVYQILNDLKFVDQFEEAIKKS